MSLQKTGHSAEWTDEKNARRVALVHKKYDDHLTAAEKKHLTVLTAEADNFHDRSEQVPNKILELVLAGLKQQAAKKTKR